MTILQHVKPKMSEHVFNTWFAVIVPLDESDNLTLKLAVRDQFARDWLQEHYGAFLHQELQNLEGQSVAVDWVIEPSLFIEKPITTDTLHASTKEEVPSDDISPQKAGKKHQSSRLVSTLNIISRTLSVVHPTNSPMPPHVQSQQNRVEATTRFFFSAMSALARPIYSPPSAIQFNPIIPTPKSSTNHQRVSRTKSSMRYSMGSSKNFDENTGKKPMSSLMDDIQLLAGKERTQHELFHIFNVMYDSNRQIVLTSDKLPHDLPNVEDRLRSRFQWGLITDIQPPEIETRVAIVKSKAAREGLELDESLAFHLARHVASNVRELEGALVRILAHASLTKRKLTIQYIDEILNNIVPRTTPDLSIEAIQEAVARYFRLKVNDLRGSQRRQSIVRPRHVAMYLCRKHVSKASFPAIGDQFGKKDHATVMNAVKKIDRALESDRSLQSQIQDLEQQLDIPQTTKS